MKHIKNIIALLLFICISQAFNSPLFDLPLYGSKPEDTGEPVAVKKLLIVYYSRTTRTAKMAEAVAQGARTVKGIQIKLLAVKDAKPQDAVWADGVILGSPVYNANPAPEILTYINSWPFEGGPMKDKIGAAFVTGGGISAGEELVQMNILQALMVHGMLAVGGGDWKSSFGASAITEEAPFIPSKNQAVQPRFLKKAKALGKRVARLLLSYK